MISGSASNTVIQAHTPRSVCVHVPGQPKPRPINRRNPLKADLVCMKMVRFHSHLLLIFLYVCETTKWEKRLSRKISAKRRMKRTLILEANFLRLSGKQKKSSLRHSSA